MLEKVWYTISNNKATEMERLAIYYEEHGQSFDELDIPENLRERFEKYSEWAKSYYEE